MPASPSRPIRRNTRNSIASSYLARLSLPVMSPEDERATFLKLRSLPADSTDPAVLGERASLSDFIARSNIRLVISIAPEWMGRTHLMSDEDTLSSGMRGLAIAINKYDLSRHTKFSTYATYWIRAEIRRDFDESDIIHVPLWLKGSVPKGVKNSKHSEYRAYAARAQSFAGPDGRAPGNHDAIHDAPSDPIDSVPSREPTPVDHAIRRELDGLARGGLATIGLIAGDDRLAAGVASLSDIERRIIQLRANGWTFRRIAGEVGGCKDNAGSLFVQAVENIRAAVDGRAPVNLREGWLRRKGETNRDYERRRKVARRADAVDAGRTAHAIAGHPDALAS